VAFLLPIIFAEFLIFYFPIAGFNRSVVNATFVDSGADMISQQIICRRIKKKAARISRGLQRMGNKD
jgi:hypothetical protein